MEKSLESAYLYGKNHLGEKPLPPHPELLRAEDLALANTEYRMVPNYIPQLKEGNPQMLGAALTDLEGKTTTFGDTDHRFTIQSIGKLISLAVALEQIGEKELARVVGMESSGDPFNSIQKLESSADHRPANPMINAGAIAVCAALPGSPAKRFESILEKTRILLGSTEIQLDEATYRSESATGSRNRALAHYMCADNIFQGDVEEHLEVYFKLCSLLVTCRELSFLGAVLARDGVSPLNNQQLIPKKDARYLRAMMLVAGMYNASGSFATRFGFPGKSGVGGGIMGAVTGQMGLAVFSPALDAKDSSYAGQKVLEHLSSQKDLFVY